MSALVRVEATVMRYPFAAAAAPETDRHHFYADGVESVVTAADARALRPCLPVSA